MTRTMKTAVAGCGAISDIYLTNMIQRFDNLEVAACCAAHYENAVKRAKQYGIKPCTLQEILKDKSIELLVNLTPAPEHYDIIRRALLAGKHVYTEKSLTVRYSEAAELSALAAKKGLYLCSAPDTFLGGALQNARKAIDSGLIGEVTSAAVFANRDLDYLAGMSKFLRLPGGGIAGDYSVYYLTALVFLLGGITEVSAVVRNPYTVRVNSVKGDPEYGHGYEYHNESQVYALLQFERGITAAFHLNGDSVLEDQAGMWIYGRRGILKLTDPNGFGGKIIYQPNPATENTSEPEELECRFGYLSNSRGIGPSEMADAIFSGRKARTDNQLACHVLEVIERMFESSRSRRFVQVKSRCV